MTELDRIAKVLAEVEHTSYRLHTLTNNNDDDDAEAVALACDLDALLTIHNLLADFHSNAVATASKLKLLKSIDDETRPGQLRVVS